MKKAKYIRTVEDEIIVFPMRMKHTDFRKFDPISAGFIELDYDGNKIVFKCTGKSIGLKLESNPEDTTLVNVYEELFE